MIFPCLSLFLLHLRILNYFLGELLLLLFFRPNTTGYQTSFWVVVELLWPQLFIEGDILMVCLIDWCYCVCPEVSCIAAKNLSVSKLTPAKLFCSATVYSHTYQFLLLWKGTLLAGKRHKNSGFVMICPNFSSLQSFSNLLDFLCWLRYVMY